MYDSPRNRREIKRNAFPSEGKGSLRTADVEQAWSGPAHNEEGDPEASPITEN